MLRRPPRLFFVMLLCVAGISLLIPLRFHSSAHGSDGPVGKRIPSFSISSGDKRTCDLSAIQGKLALIFYEARSSVKKNVPLKHQLKLCLLDQPEEIRQRVVIVPVIDCTSAFFGVRRFWERSLVEHSRIEGFTIYGDWDGKMKKDLGLKEGDSNFLVVDRSGFIRLYHSGKIDEDSYESIKSFLLQLATDSR